MTKEGDGRKRKRETNRAEERRRCAPSRLGRHLEERRCRTERRSKDISAIVSSTSFSTLVETHRRSLLLRKLSHDRSILSIAPSSSLSVPFSSSSSSRPLHLGLGHDVRKHSVGSSRCRRSCRSGEVSREDGSNETSGSGGSSRVGGSGCQRSRSRGEVGFRVRSWRRRTWWWEELQIDIFLKKVSLG